MSVRTTSEVIDRFNRAFTDREAGLLSAEAAEAADA